MTPINGCMVEFDIGKMKRILTRVNGLEVGGGTLLRRSISCKKPIPLFLTRWRSSFTRWRSSYPPINPLSPLFKQPTHLSMGSLFLGSRCFFVAFHYDILCTQTTNKMVFGTWRQQSIQRTSLHDHSFHKISNNVCWYIGTAGCWIVV